MIDKSIVVIDDGLFCSWAERLVREFRKVYYFCPWQESDNSLDNYLMGTGIPGVERLEYLHDMEDEIDIFFFTDINYADWQEDLRRKGKQVFGLGWAEEFELDRRMFYDFLKENDMLVSPYDEVDGIHNLRKYVETRKKEGFIKASRFRKNWESYHHEDPEESMEFIDYKISQLGVRGDAMEFTVEDMVDDAIEVGGDLLTCDGKFPEYGVFGLEIKDKMYAGRVMKISEMPEQIIETTDVLSKLFKKYRSRGSFSTENRVTKKGKNYFIDFCARQGNPPGSCLQEAYTNWGEIIDGLSQGKLVEPIPACKYVVEAHVFSHFCCNWKTKVRYPKEYANYVKMKQYYMVGENRYKIPRVGYNIVASVVGIGETLEEAVNMLKTIINEVKCNESDNAEKFMDDAVNKLKKLDEYGMDNPFEFEDNEDDQPKTMNEAMEKDGDMFDANTMDLEEYDEETPFLEKDKHGGFKLNKKRELNSKSGGL